MGNDWPASFGVCGVSTWWVVEGTDAGQFVLAPMGDEERETWYLASGRLERYNTELDEVFAGWFPPCSPSEGEGAFVPGVCHAY